MHKLPLDRPDAREKVEGEKEAMDNLNKLREQDRLRQEKLEMEATKAAVVTEKSPEVPLAPEVVEAEEEKSCELKCF